MFSIGEFSKITGLTVKTLRFYHAQEVLFPSRIDEQSGYRYYDRNKIETARVVTYLRSADFSLSEIREILRQIDSGEEILGILVRQKVAIEERIRRSRKIVRSLQRFITEEKEARIIMSQSRFEVEEKIVPTLLMAGIRMKGRYSDCGKAFAGIGRALGRHIWGKAMLLHYDTEYKEDDADFEACMPVRQARQVEGISVRELAGGRCVSLLHKGPYDQLGQSYAKILTYVREKGYRILFPTREVYLKGPGMIFKGNPKNYLTEIQILIEE